MNDLDLTDLDFRNGVHIAQEGCGVHLTFVAGTEAEAVDFAYALMAQISKHPANHMVTASIQSKKRMMTSSEVEMLEILTAAAEEAKDSSGRSCLNADAELIAAMDAEAAALENDDERVVMPPDAPISK